MENKTTPNVLVVITDQQRADHVGFMGNKVLQTPNFDALAKRSMVFDNAWVSNPVCMPNRSTMLTGRMPSSHGVVFNDRSLDWNTNTFVRRFKRSGYRTGLIGKSHLQHGVSKISMMPYRGEPSSMPIFEEGWDTVEDFERYHERVSNDPNDFYGFDHIELALDHGASVAGHHYQWAINKGAKKKDLVVNQDALSNGSDRSSHWQQIYRPPYPEELHSTTFVTERTIAFIDEAEQQDKPWLTWCSFPDPHHPMTPPGKWFDKYRPDDMELPPSLRDELASAPAHLRLFSKIHPKDQRNWVAPCGYGNEELLRQAMAATYGMIGMVDEGVGKILQHLETLGVRDNTIVLFTSDHGDMMGDHGLFLKGFMHYRGTLQVPFILDVPAAKAGRSSALASSIDIAPTLMSLCGIDGYDGIQGMSLEPLLSEPDGSVRDSILIEDDVPIVTSKLTPIPARIRTALAGDYKYTRNSKGEEQLFDLRNDPDEMQDIRDDKTRRSEMLTVLTDMMMLADDSSRGAPSTITPTL